MYFQELVDSATPLIYTIMAILAVSMVIQLIYHLFIYSKVYRFKGKGPGSQLPAISVIICAKNEAENLKNNLPTFLSQDYPEYEVVVVNDCSTDETEDVLMELKAQYPNLHFTTIQEDRKFKHGKKLALTVGIKAAKHEHLLLSDADCYPLSNKWIRSMAANFSTEKTIVLGIGKYERKKGLLNILVRYETLITAMQYISAALIRKPYMGVGRNLAYTKTLFFDNKGFASHLKVLSGDDDLFINETATSLNTAVEISADSFTLSEAPSGFGIWFKQKKRHLSTGKYYKAGSKWRLGMEYLSRVIFYAAAITLSFFDPFYWIALGAWLLLAVVRSIVLKLTMRKLQERDLLLPSLLLDLVMPFLLLIFRLANIIRPREPKWN